MNPSGIHLGKVAKIPLFAAAAGAVGSAWLVVRDARSAMYVYLAAFAFVASTTLGGLALVMIAHSTGARWFAVVRRLGEAIASAMPALILFFLPMAVAVPLVYPWARPRDGLEEHVRLAIAHARAWMNTPWFLLRAAIYLAVWVVLSESLLRASRAEDRDSGTRAHCRQQTLSAAGIPIIGLTGSFAAFDWVMSAVPGWNFNILGAYLLIGGFSAAVGAMAVLVHLGRRSGLLPSEVGPAHIHAIGRLLLMSVCLWAYMAISALIIVWSANLPHETGFYVMRSTASWRYLAAVLGFGHFVVPFLALLVRALKRNSASVAVLGAWMILMHAVDVYWLVVPAAKGGMAALDVAPFVLLAALAALVGAFRFSRAPAVPIHDPDLGRSLAYESL